MDNRWNETQRALRANFMDFGKTIAAPGSIRRDRTAEFDFDLWRKIADSGFWKISVPKELGGDGGELSDFIAALEGLSRGANDPGYMVSVGAHGSLIQLLLRYGTQEQQEQYIPRLMSGEVGATACTEPTGGSHVTGIRTTARARSAGEFELTGQKCHITNAPVADISLIVGRVADVGKRDITLFLIERGQQGISQGAPEDLIGLRSSPLGPITMDASRITPDRIIGEIGNGIEMLYWCLAFDRLNFGIIASAHMDSFIPQALERATTREAFGVPIAEHQYIQDKIVLMKVAAETARQLSYATLSALENGDDAQANSLASCTKLAAAQGIVAASQELLQIFGHLGFDRDFGIERQLRDAAAFRIAGGTDEMQKKNIFGQLLAEHRTARA
ncbi:isovaleryl-CoA dehydrogenase [Streptomyces albospinus]|uniref:Isovaleryl-CoA dehydrogenase n=1 Tax=Streptomyces albospinus TaxID=285515 RepID=A0ABQ2VP96_9ACTN|nr:acyl-CoA dehydrogenase family protein [Streptomyces albospinus]GGV02256.1 isovaleryl-CoA dehydrogenase [Streptomyces albospinus]